MLRRPDDLFDREHEWAELAAFVSSEAPGLRIALLSGRRRFGKSYLLRRLADAAPGPTLVHQARELTSAQALEEFTADVVDALGLPDGVRFGTWEESLRASLPAFDYRTSSRRSAFKVQGASTTPTPRASRRSRHGHRGRKDDPLYRARRTLHTGHDLLTANAST